MTAPTLASGATVREGNFAFKGKYEDQLGVPTKLIRSSKYCLVAYTLIHTVSCGWYLLACPNESDAVGPLKCYASGWAVVKQQSK